MTTKNYWLILFLLLHFTAVCFGQRIIRLDKTEISEADLDAKSKQQ